MQENPFKHPDSPILHLYQRSRQKSLQNLTVQRTRSNSFRDFKVKVIRNAIDRQHIIQKQYNSQQEKEAKRERQLSKYYGIETLKYDKNAATYARPMQETSSKKGIQITKKPAQRRRSSDRVSSLLNIKAENLNCLGYRYPMSYESNYIINQQSTNEMQGSNYCRSSARKVSIASQIEENAYDEGNYYKKSRFVNERRQQMDSVQEQYATNNDYQLIRRRKSKRMSSDS